MTGQPLPNPLSSLIYSSLYTTAPTLHRDQAPTPSERTKRVIRLSSAIMEQRPPSNDIGLKDQSQYSPTNTPRKGPRAQDGSKQEATPKNQVDMVSPEGQSCGQNTREQITAMFPGLSVTSTAEPPGLIPSTTPSSTQSSHSHFEMENASVSQGDLVNDIYQYLADGPEGLESAECFACAAPLPLVTRDSLSELNTHRFINNPKLRHDINFDRDLHFRPNLDGSKGKQKVKLAHIYWKSLSAEFYLYFLVGAALNSSGDPCHQAYWLTVRKHSQRRLPNLFSSIRDVLKTLVPNKDHAAIVEKLDVDFLMQQIQNGVCDLVELADWFAAILKKHCAPMRDRMVDKMRLEIHAGARESNYMKLVEGLRQLVNILEAMKLDVANHQIRHMRSLLVADTINFHRHYAAYRVSNQKIDAIAARRWFDESSRELSVGRSARVGHLEVISSNVLRGLLFNDDADLYPQTFNMDSDRLRSWQVELHSLVYMKICCLIFREMVDPFVEPLPLASAEKSLYKTLSSIVGVSGKFDQCIANIAVEIMRHANQADGRDSTIDPKLLDFIEYKLEGSMTFSSDMFELAAGDIAQRVLPKLLASVNEHVTLSAVDLQERLVPLPPPGHHPLSVASSYTPTCFSSVVDADDNIVRRMTHMIVLHWQTWADLVYLAPLPQGGHLFPSNGGLSPPPSPSMPVSQAIYSPGGKFLPIQISTTEVPSSLPSPSPSPRPEIQALHTSLTQETMTSSDLDEQVQPPNDTEPPTNS